MTPARCSRCHRPLTDPESLVRGRGPVCAGRRSCTEPRARRHDAAMPGQLDLLALLEGPRPVVARCGDRRTRVWHRGEWVTPVTVDALGAWLDREGAA